MNDKNQSLKPEEISDKLEALRLEKKRLLALGRLAAIDEELERLKSPRGEDSDREDGDDSEVE